MKKNILTLLASLVISTFLLELLIGLGTKFELFPIKVPSYSIEQAKSRHFWNDINPDFGVWRKPNAQLRHIRACFDVPYRANSFGARDTERTINAEKPRVIVLGDSFMEGMGLITDDRLSNRLEKSSGIEHLNFATSGSFGTIQYYLVYKTLAKKFSHSTVIIGMLPANDFVDNDYEYGKHVFANRYRPYFVGDFPNYDLIYYKGTLDQSWFYERDDWFSLSKRFLSEFTYSYNALAYFKLLIVSMTNPEILKDHVTRVKEFNKKSGGNVRGNNRYSGYYDYRQDQLDLVKYTFLKIREEAAEKKVIVVLLPTLVDHERFETEPTPPLTRELKIFGIKHNIQIIDLLPLMHKETRNWKSYHFSCDPHWSSFGHAVAAKLIHNILYEDP